jgi:tight adherence protein B
VIALLIGVIGALGVFYLFTAAIGWKGVGIAPLDVAKQSKERKTFTTWMTQSGIVDVTPAEFIVAGVATASLAGLLTFVLFGAELPAMAVALFGATAPTAAYRKRRLKLRSQAREAWPRLIEELRVQTSSIGRSVPIALLDVGAKSPTAPMRAAFEEANRQWLLTTDFSRTVQVLKDRLADPSADAVCETLLVAHDLGGSDLDKRLRSLIDDRTADLEERRDAISRQSGVRFARWFTLVVPIGMSFVGMTIGNGRDSYRTASGQLSLLVAVACTSACWMWASRIMVLPEPQRVLDT